MKNITLAIDEAVLDEVRQYAAKNKTTVNGLVRDYLVRLAAQQNKAEAARQRLLDLARNSEGDMGADFKWDREAIYDRR